MSTSASSRPGQGRSTGKAAEPRSGRPVRQASGSSQEDLVRAVPKAKVRLSAGRESMSEATQALCFLAGANSIFTGDKLLTAPNAGDDSDAALMAKLGLTALQGEEPMRAWKAVEAAE